MASTNRSDGDGSIYYDKTRGIVLELRLMMQRREREATR